jgi:type IV pilus assembly protein PilW
MYLAIHRSRSSGFSIIELMVAMLLSLVLLGGVMTLFANSRSAYETNERLARIQENGRFALEQIVRDVRAAAYPGCAKRIPTKPLKNALTNSTQLLWNFAVPVEGFDGSTSSWNPALTTPANTDRLDSDGTGPDVDGPTPNTDVLVVRRIRSDLGSQRVKTTSTGTAAIQVWAPPNSITAGDVVLATTCEGASVFQVSAYSVNTTTQTGTISHATGGSFVPGNSTADIGNILYQATSEVLPVETVIYFIDTGTAGNGTSLYRRIGNAAAEELVEGVDSMQLQFGVDTNNDANHLVDDYVTANSVTNWGSVVSVRVALLVRSLEEYGSDVDSVSRTLLGATIPAFNDRRDRRIFTTTATLRNKLF